MPQYSLKQQLTHSISLFICDLHDLLRPIHAINQFVDKMKLLHLNFKRINHWIDVANRQRKLQAVKLIKTGEIPVSMVIESDYNMIDINRHMTPANITSYKTPNHKNMINTNYCKNMGDHVDNDMKDMSNSNCSNASNTPTGHETSKNRDITNINISYASKYDSDVEYTIGIYSFTSSECNFCLFIHETFGLIRVDTGSLQLDCKVMEYYEKECKNIRDGIKKRESELMGGNRRIETTFDRIVDDSENLAIEQSKNSSLESDDSFFVILIEKLELFLSLYTDHLVRVCDYCLKNEIVIERSIEKDYFGAYHKGCMRKYE